jgi:hypothetical protein
VIREMKRKMKMRWTGYIEGMEEKIIRGSILYIERKSATGDSWDDCIVKLVLKIN